MIGVQTLVQWCDVFHLFWKLSCNFLCIYCFHSFFSTFSHLKPPDFTGVIRFFIVSYMHVSTHFALPLFCLLDFFVLKPGYFLFSWYWKIDTSLFQFTYLVFYCAHSSMKYIYSVVNFSYCIFSVLGFLFDPLQYISFNSQNCSLKSTF